EVLARQLPELQRALERTSGCSGKRGCGVARGSRIGAAGVRLQQSFDAHRTLYRRIAAHRGARIQVQALGNGIEAWSHAFQRLGLVRYLELQERGLLNHFDRALRIVDSRQFHDQPGLADPLHERLSDAEFVNTGTNHAFRAGDRVGRVGNGALRFIYLEGHVHSATQVESALQRYALDRIVGEHSISLDALDRGTRPQSRDRRDYQRGDHDEAVLQVGHSTAGD